MSEVPLNQNLDNDVNNAPILIYRGVKRSDEEQDRKGVWWTTDPYYAFAYSGGGQGKMFVASVDKKTLDNLAKDVTNESNYENYLFPETDPPGARIVTDNELERLKEATTVTTDSGLPGGAIIKRPDNAIEIGQTIFNSGDAGAVALGDTVLLDIVKAK